MMLFPAAVELVPAVDAVDELVLKLSISEDAELPPDP
jgi:hypothetical protein